jgi:hypothetical protein
MEDENFSTMQKKSGHELEILLLIPALRVPQRVGMAGQTHGDFWGLAKLASQNITIS